MNREYAVGDVVYLNRTDGGRASPWKATIKSVDANGYYLGQYEGSVDRQGVGQYKGSDDPTRSWNSDKVFAGWASEADVQAFEFSITRSQLIEQIRVEAFRASQGSVDVLRQVLDILRNQPPRSSHEEG